MSGSTQASLFSDTGPDSGVSVFSQQLLKWIGNKQRFAHEIARRLPSTFNTYLEPFLGSGAVLGTLAPKRGIAGDAFRPLAEIWSSLGSDPETLKEWYADRWNLTRSLGKVAAYEEVKASFNRRPNGADLVFLCRSCYGGVVRFRKADGYMSTPCGPHDPIRPESFSKRVDEWHSRTRRTTFLCADYREVMRMARKGDVVYCDPPYRHSQAILYGAQAFELAGLFAEIERCKGIGVDVVLSIDGTKKTGASQCLIEIPRGLFQHDVFLDCGRSMLRRFQMAGQSLEHEIVQDRLLTTF